MAVVDDFSQWVMQNGGNEEFVEALRGFGFSSKLSLSNLCLESPDSEGLLDHLNFGQRCLLKGLVSLASTEMMESTMGNQSCAYSGSISRTKEVSSKARNLRHTLGKLFNKKTIVDSEGESSTHYKAKRPLSDDDDFEPTLPRYKGKGKQSLTNRVKKKIKEFRIRVVGLNHFSSTTPVGSEKNVKNIWIRETDSAAEVEKKIKDCFDWTDCTCRLQYLYASGRHLRKAKIEDVRNAESWDASSVRALMGNGCLYVSRIYEVLDESDDSEKDEVSANQIATMCEAFPSLSRDMITNTLSKQSVSDAIEFLLLESKKMNNSSELHDQSASNCSNLQSSMPLKKDHFISSESHDQDQSTSSCSVHQLFVPRNNDTMEHSMYQARSPSPKDYKFWCDELAPIINMPTSLKDIIEAIQKENDVVVPEDFYDYEALRIMRNLWILLLDVPFLYKIVLRKQEKQNSVPIKSSKSPSLVRRGLILGVCDENFGDC